MRTTDAEDNSHRISKLSRILDYEEDFAGDV